MHGQDLLMTNQIVSYFVPNYANFLLFRPPIAWPWGWDMGCLLWVQSMIHVYRWHCRDHSTIGWSNERRCHIVTVSLIAWTNTENVPCIAQDCSNLQRSQGIFYIRVSRISFLLTFFPGNYSLIERPMPSIVSGPGRGQWNDVSDQTYTTRTLETRTKWPPFADKVFKCIFMNDSIWISSKISLEIVADGPIDNKLASVQVNRRCQTSDKPLPEPMLSEFHDAIWRHQGSMKDIGWSGARLTKAYDVTIQRYRNSHAKIEDSKMHILRCMGSKFCVKFQRCPLKFHTKFWTHTPQNINVTRC